jgi:hypothetical protein
MTHNTTKAIAKKKINNKTATFCFVAFVMIKTSPLVITVTRHTLGNMKNARDQLIFDVIW